VGGVILFRQTGCHFIGGRGMERRWPKVGVRRRATVVAGRGGFGSVLAGFGLGVGALWAGVGEITPVSIVQRAEGKRGGSGRFPPCLPCLTARVGAGEAGARQRGVHEHGYRARANGNRVGHSRIDFLDFCPPGVRQNARMNFKFEFLKTSTVGCHHIGQ
jgi:hypothetical protein